MKTTRKTEDTRRVAIRNIKGKCSYYVSLMNQAIHRLIEVIYKEDSIVDKQLDTMAWLIKILKEDFSRGSIQIMPNLLQCEDRLLIMQEIRNTSKRNSLMCVVYNMALDFEFIHWLTDAGFSLMLGIYGKSQEQKERILKMCESNSRIGFLPLEMRSLIYAPLDCVGESIITNQVDQALDLITTNTDDSCWYPWKLIRQEKLALHPSAIRELETLGIYTVFGTDQKSKQWIEAVQEQCKDNTHIMLDKRVRETGLLDLNCLIDCILERCEEAISKGYEKCIVWWFIFPLPVTKSLIECLKMLETRICVGIYAMNDEDKRKIRKLCKDSKYFTCSKRFTGFCISTSGLKSNEDTAIKATL